MSRIVYVNGDFLPEKDAKISVFDRGFLFADGVYEVSSILEGRLIDNEAHLARLERSLSELEMALPIPVKEFVEAQEKLVADNNVKEGALYLQVTRGVADRDFAYPKDVTPSLVMFTQAKNLITNEYSEKGIAIISIEDIRWARRDIKTVQLLAPAMAKQAALNAGANDAWLVEDGFVTEGSSNNAYIVKDGVLITRQLSNSILHGITRAAVLQLCKEDDVKLEERPFTMSEAYDADEAFITSATTFVWLVVKMDGNDIATGKPGPITKRLRQLYIDTALKK